ncbi:MAG: hypothetical protein RLZZ608_970 [Actinomycetota bacterium]|jgi:hypothetical protein
MTDSDDLTDDDVARLSSALRAHLQPLQHTRPTPATDAVADDLAQRRIRRLRAGTIAAIAAVSAGALAVSLTVGTPGDAAWAADPSPVTDDLIDDVSSACGAALNPGSLEQSGSASATDTPTVESLGTATESTGGMLAPPTELPDLVAIDVRGDGGFAVFSTGDIGTLSTSVFCVVSLDGETSVTSLSSEVGPATPGSAGVSLASGTTIAGQAGSSTLTGSLVEGATSVEVVIDGLPTARASIVDSRYAIWWPSTTGALVRQLDAAGQVLAETPVG